MKLTKSARSILTLVVLLIVVLGAGYYLFAGSGIIPGRVVKDRGSNISDYSAVFLTNGQVYFGKIYSGGDELDLQDIYYLQVSQQQSLQPDTSKTAAATASPEISLVKLGKELHGPNDRMRINKDQVLFVESLMKDSKVVTAISNYKDKQ